MLVMKRREANTEKAYARINKAKHNVAAVAGVSMYAAIILVKTCVLLRKQREANTGKADARKNKAKHEVAAVADVNMCAGNNSLVPEFMLVCTRHAGLKAGCVRAGLVSSRSFAFELTPKDGREQAGRQDQMDRDSER